jgi:hypothetical protein
MEQPEVTLVRYRQALETIFHQEGKVCAWFKENGCAHPGCRSSESAWLIAREALFPPFTSPLLPSPKEKSHEQP